MGDSILSSLSAVTSSRVTKLPEQPNQSEPLEGLSDDTHTVSFVDDVAVEIITVTDYAEVELGTSTDIEMVIGADCCEVTDTITVAEDSLVVLPDETNREEEVEAGGEETQEKPASGSTDITLPEANTDDLASSQHKASVGPHDCPDCEKKFKFASSLTAHRVIHTGERPHRCDDCGRRFSFRQSLDRHRHTHKTGRKYNCVICGETFHSLSARTEHKQTHMEDGVYTCHQCSKTFNWELALARHLKTHTDDHSADKLTEGQDEDQEVGEGDQSVSVSEVTAAVTEPDSQVQAEHDGDGDLERVEVQCSEPAPSEPEVAAPEVDNEVTNEVISLTKVRTSGRKRKPTMKIQVINLQKRMTTKRRKEMPKASPPELKPLPFNW